MSVDLHLHTHYSDGSWSPTELVSRALELKLHHIAITDHDTTDGIDEAIAAANGRLEVIPAIEINTIWLSSDGHQQDVHILGYFIDKDNVKLKALIQQQQEARLKLAHDTIEALSALGINLSFVQVKECAGVGSIGRPHITQAIVKAGGALDVTEAFEKFMVRGSPYYVHRESVTPEAAIKAIVGSGGIASLAHPGKSVGIDQIIPRFQASGLQAIEAYHRRHNLKLVRHYIRLAHHQGLIVTGGSDCHGPLCGFPASIGSISIPQDIVETLRTLHLKAPCC
ncbi:MAG: PHP domain-containing protein [Candidatus Melainabacteria bacterium]|nr:PHP domain-containing protein [Candidatus Melainabacteria bacterium]